MKQMTLAVAKGFEKHGRATRKAEFLARMEGLMSWTEFCAVIEPHYPKVGNGHPLVGLERVLRMYCVANWFNLTDIACENALYDVPVFGELFRIDVGRERSSDATTLLNFRHLLEAHRLGAALLAKIGELLLANGMKLSGGTIVDAPRRKYPWGATLIAAPPSTKNTEMHQTKKGNEWRFGMKLHIGVDNKTGLVHSASVTTANIHDSHEVPNILHCKEPRLYGESAYRGKAQRERLKTIAPKANDFTNRRAYKNRPLTDAHKASNWRKSSIRSKVEHPFLTPNRLWGFAKVRYRCLAKNANRAFAMLAMLNISKWGLPLTGEVHPT